MGITEFLEIISTHGFENVALMGFVTLPKSHAFATYGILQKVAQGADNYALYWDVTYQVRLFYRDGKTAADYATEKLIEQDIREFDGLTAKFDYNSEDSLDITFYEFKTREDF